MSNFYQIICDTLAHGEPFALGIIAKTKGSSPQKTGAKALFFADGRIVGTLGGGCLEAEVRDRARRALLSQTPVSFDLLLDHDFGWDDGLICGGSVSGLILPNAPQAAPVWHTLAGASGAVTWGVGEDFSIALVDNPTAAWRYQETLLPPCHLWIAGSGHIAQAVAPLAQKLDFAVTVFDDRPEFANTNHFPVETRLRVDAWEKLLAEPMPPAPVLGLIVTRGHQHDALVLSHWLGRSFAFLGMIGSKRKARTIFEQLLADGVAGEEQLMQVCCPVGLPIAAETVHEIAVSIMAQYLQKRAELRYEKVHCDVYRNGVAGCH